MSSYSYAQLAGAGFLETISRPDVMDQALLYMAPWHWKEKQKEEKKEHQRAMESKREEHRMEQARMAAEQEAARVDTQRRDKAIKQARVVMKSIQLNSGGVSEALGKAHRTAARYGLSERVRTRVQEIEQASISLLVNLPTPRTSASTVELEGVALQLEQSLAVMTQLRGQAETLAAEVAQFVR